MDQQKDRAIPRCDRCGSERIGETAGGLCPRCLLEMNFASRTMPGGEASPHLPPPSPEEMADRFPQFEILECLGRGGMGIVYKARQKTLDRLVAIKVLAGERRDDPQFEARFSREARTLAKLSHPNIVTVHDFGESDGMFYLVMEYVDGVNLRDVLRDDRMEPAEALGIVPSICEALQFAHDHGVVHRDIKPENILMDRDGRVKIADFGIATMVGAAAERSGTPPYMAPEQEAADRAVDHRADIYALGVVFYEMLTGERPEQDPSRPSRRVEIDVRLDEIVLRALEKEPEQRYQTAGEFRTVVETIASTPHWKADSPSQEQGSSGKRVKAFAIGFALVSVLNIIAAGFWAAVGSRDMWPDSATLPFVLHLVAGIGFGVACYRRLWRRNTRGDHAPRKRHRVRLAIAGTAATAMAVACLLAWSQRPRLVDEKVIAADSPDGRFSATGRTWRAMRIFDSDRISYRFTVQGRAGGKVEKWEVEAPRGKPGAGDIPPPGDEILFGRHGRILWSDDSRWASFQVNGIEVAGFDAGAGKPTDPGRALNTPEQVAREHMEAVYSGDADRALNLLGPPWSETREDIKEAIWRLQIQGKTEEEAPEFVEWRQEGPYAVTSWEYPPKENGVDHNPYHRKPYLVLERFAGTWRVVWGNDTRADASLSEILQCFKQFRSVSREDPMAVARAFVTAFGKGDADAAGMLSAPPLSYQRDELARAIAKASQAQGAPGRKPASPLGWHQDGPYAVTRARLLHDEPETETYLVLRRTGKIWRVVGANVSSPEASLAENLNHYKQEMTVGRLTVEDLALRFLVAIREQDERTLRELCVDRTKGWTEALVGQFSMELRERFRESTGEDFALYPGQIRVKNDLAVIQCLAFEDIQQKLNGNCLVLHFCRTASGWKVWTASKAPESQPLEDHLAQARKWAAEWEETSPGTDGSGEVKQPPEPVARAFMDALRRRDSDQAAKLIDRPISRRELDNLGLFMNQLYGEDRERFTTFVEWFREEPHAVAALPAPPDRPDSKLVIILKRSGEIWKVTAGPLPSDSDTPLADHLRRVLKDRQRPVDQAKALPVTPPASMPEGSPLTVEQLKKVLEGVTWSEFITAFADDGHGHEVSWRETAAEGGSSMRFEVTFPLGGEKMVLELEVDPEFQRAMPVGLRSTKRPDETLADPAEFLPQMAVRYAVKSDHPAAAPAMERVKERVQQVKTLSAIREYATAIAICREDTTALPPTLQSLVEKKYIREMSLMMNHETGMMEEPLYHGSPDLKVKELDVKTILLAAPSVDRKGKRVVGFLDGSVKVIDEADYQKRLEAQRKPPLEQTVDAFLESCATGRVDTGKEMFAALGMAEFMEQFGDGERAMREHHEHLPPIMRFAIAKSTGEPTPEITRYLQSVHVATASRHKIQAGLLLRTLGVSPRDKTG